MIWVVSFEKIEKIDIHESDLEKISKNMEKISDVKELDKPIAIIIKEVRNLTQQEIQNVKEKIGWPDEKFKKCTMDEDGIIHYKTDRCDLEGKISENGVPYERKAIEINGVKMEGVFPEFKSKFDTYLSLDNLKTKLYAKECNGNLREQVEKDPELRKEFTKEQLGDIQEGRTPRGYVWHHNEEPGKMQLVKREDHDRAIGGAAHTGGSSLWGPDSVDKSKKEGVSF